jgi:hypothetical protein
VSKYQREFETKEVVYIRRGKVIIVVISNTEGRALAKFVLVTKNTTDNVIAAKTLN